MKCGSQNTILIVVFVFMNTNFCLSTPFLPIFLEDRGISSTWIGIIFAIFAFGTTISSIFSGKIVDKVGHKIVLILSIIFMSDCTVSFGLINRIESESYVIAIACLLRFGQGSAYGAANTAVYSFCAQAYPDDVEKSISIMEGVTGIGFMLGPILGSYIYHWIGFSKTYFCAGLMLVPIVFLICCLDPPKRL